MDIVLVRGYNAAERLPYNPSSNPQWSTVGPSVSAVGSDHVSPSLNVRFPTDLDPATKHPINLYQSLAEDPLLPAFGEASAVNKQKPGAYAGQTAKLSENKAWHIETPQRLLNLLNTQNIASVWDGFSSTILSDLHTAAYVAAPLPTHLMTQAVESGRFTWGLPPKKASQENIDTAGFQLGAFLALAVGPGKFSSWLEAFKINASILLGKKKVFWNKKYQAYANDLNVAKKLGVSRIRPSANNPDFLKLIEESDTIIWVVTKDGKLFVGPRQKNGIRIAHSILPPNGGPVSAAGEATHLLAIPSKKGGTTQIVGDQINRMSGHFQPSADSLDIGVQAFRKAGIEFLNTYKF